MPSLVELADQLGVSRETVRLAAGRLEQEGLLVKRRRRGTMLNPPTVPDELRPPRPKVLGYLQADYGSEGGDDEAVTRGLAAHMLDGALEIASKTGIPLLVQAVRPPQLRHTFEQFSAAGHLQGVIFASVAEEKFLRRLGGLNLPAVLLDHHLNLPRIGSLRSDSQQCGQLAVERLAALGHRRIACGTWQREDLNPWFLRGYLLGMRAAGLKPRKSWQLGVELTSQGARHAVRRLLALSPRPTALICFNNTFARHVVEAAIQEGLTIPEDLSVFGGGGEVVAGLTCNQINWTELGRQAMEMLLAAIEKGPDKPSEHRLVPYHYETGSTTEEWRS